jgi:hypothetical protein
MKKILIRLLTLSLLVLLTLSAVSCNNDIEVPEGMQLCSDDSLEYLFFVPAAWIVNTQSGTTSATRSLSDPASVTVTLYTPETSLDIDGYWDLCEEEYKAEFKNYVFVSETETTVAGLKAKEYVYTADFSGETYKFSQTIFIERSKFYVITYTAKADSFDKYLTDLKQMKDEMKFR